MNKNLLLSSLLLVSSVFALLDESQSVLQSDVIHNPQAKNLLNLDAITPELSQWNVRTFNNYAECFCGAYKSQNACNDILNDVNCYERIIQKLYVSAAYCGEKEILEQIINHTEAKDVVLDVRVMYGHTALMMAAYNNRSACVSLLLEKEGGRQDDLGRTALMMAATSVESARLLVDVEAGITDKKKQTALMEAVKYNYPECVRLLADREHDIRDKDGKTALDYAIYSAQNSICGAPKPGSEEIIQILREKNTVE